MSEERMRILKMFEDGKINADEAAKLLSAVEKKVGGIVCCAGEGARKVLHVEIRGEGEDKPKVNVNVPLELIRVGLGLIPKEARSKMEEKGIDLEKLSELIETGIEGKLVEVEHVKEGGKETITVEIE